jgi:hypothetical protein
MPLLDHFHPPLSERRHWDGFHSRWASAIADGLNAKDLPENLFAEPTVTVGSRVEVDVATLEEADAEAKNAATATVHLPAPAWVIPAAFPDSFEVQLISTEGGPRLVAAIELVSPANKDRPASRRVFGLKCASYLCQGIGLIVVDVVTTRLANLHNEMMDLLQIDNCRIPPDNLLYATAYRPVRRDGRDEIDVWQARLEVGSRLPNLPLFVGADLPVLVDFEASYVETCQRLRLVA